MNVLPGVGKALRDLAARRLARSYLGLGALGVLSLGEWALTGFGSGPALVALVGVPVSALALFGVGWRAVRRGSGAPPAPWMTLALAGAVLPFLHGVFVFGIPGLRRMALEGFTSLALLLGAGYALLGLRLLRDAIRVGEVDRLGAAMAIPAPEEEQEGAR